MKKHKNSKIITPIISLSAGAIIFAVATLMLAYSMTKEDMPPLTYGALYCAITGLSAFVVSFINGKRLSLHPLLVISIGFVLMLILSVVPVLAVCCDRLGAGVIILPTVSLVFSFFGTLASRKI